jgi:HSP20 family molecular chaperone IbpA
MRGGIKILKSTNSPQMISKRRSWRPSPSYGGLNMIYRSLFPRDVLAELDRLQREMQQGFHLSPSIRGIARGGFPAMNVGGTPQSVEIYAFAPGIDPATLDVQIEKGVLTVAGERKRGTRRGSHGAHRRAFRRSLPARRDAARRRRRRMRSTPSTAMACCASASPASSPRNHAASPFSKEDRRCPIIRSRQVKQPAARDEAALLPPVDVIEDASGITLYADLPGRTRRTNCSCTWRPTP